MRAARVCTLHVRWREVGRLLAKSFQPALPPWPQRAVQRPGSGGEGSEHGEGGEEGGGSDDEDEDEVGDASW